MCPDIAHRVSSALPAEAAIKRRAARIRRSRAPFSVFVEWDPEQLSGLSSPRPAKKALVVVPHPLLDAVPRVAHDRTALAERFKTRGKQRELALEAGRRQLADFKMLGRAMRCARTPVPSSRSIVKPLDHPHPFPRCLARRRDQEFFELEVNRQSKQESRLASDPRSVSSRFGMGRPAGARGAAGLVIPGLKLET